jgi:hypothetical protein
MGASTWWSPAWANPPRFGKTWAPPATGSSSNWWGVVRHRDGIGARIRIGNRHNHMSSAVSYASSSHAGVHFGLGTLAEMPKIEIRWPSGTGAGVGKHQGEPGAELAGKVAWTPRLAKVWPEVR